MRKFLLILIFLFPLLWACPFGGGLVWSQGVDSCKQNFVIAWKKLEASRDSNKVLNSATNKLLRADSADQKTIKYMTNQINELDSEIELFKIREVKNDVSSFITWDGFYLNFIPAYIFDPAYVSNQIVKTLKYAISCEFTFKVIDKFKLAIEPILPIGDKFRIQGKIGYKLF